MNLTIYFPWDPAILLPALNGKRKKIFLEVIFFCNEYIGHQFFEGKSNFNRKWKLMFIKKTGSRVFIRSSIPDHWTGKHSSVHQREEGWTEWPIRTVERRPATSWDKCSKHRNSEAPPRCREAFLPCGLVYVTCFSRLNPSEGEQIGGLQGAGMGEGRLWCGYDGGAGGRLWGEGSSVCWQLHRRPCGLKCTEPCKHRGSGSP